MGDYTNKNGLVDGNIPAGKPCPFLDNCKAKFERCPTPENLKPVAFSCALARLHSLIGVSESEGNSPNLLKKVRDGMKPPSKDGT